MAPSPSNLNIWYQRDRGQVEILRKALKSRTRP
jgi:hypothetical protein